jgi:predicted RNA methylase
MSALIDRKTHWEKIYATKGPQEMSWTQEVPRISLDFIRMAGIGPASSIIDVGAGDSQLVDHLMAMGYEDITVLDVSANAIDRAKMRLGEAAEKIHWVVSDITEFVPEKKYHLWHDRAVFHFLTNETEISKYMQVITKCVSNYALIATFSEQGPLKCSGLEVSRYSAKLLEKRFQKNFRLIHSLSEDHVTPFGTTQNFVYSLFQRS